MKSMKGMKLYKIAKRRCSIKLLASVLRFLPFDAQIYDAHTERAANDIDNQIGNGRVAAYHE